MNQGKLNVVRKEMARVNTDILGISELKWMGMGEFNSNAAVSGVLQLPLGCAGLSCVEQGTEHQVSVLRQRGVLVWTWAL